jgi:hypothetical protein
MSLLDRLRTILGQPRGGEESGEKAAPPTPTPTPTPVPPSLLESSHDTFVERLNEALMRHADVVSGRVHMIGLDEIKASFGERWPKIAAAADKITRQAIERRLSTSDIYTPYGESNYLIVFAGLSGIEAQMKCALMVREISEKLLGTQGSEERLQVNTVVFKANGVLELRPVSNFDGLIQEFEVRWADQQARQREVELRWESSEDQEAAWNAIVKRLRFGYRPVWTVRSHAIAAYSCKPMLRTPGGDIATSYAVVPPEAPTRFLSRLDLLALRQAAQDLVAMEREGKAVLLVISVHYETLARTRARIAYVSELQMIAENLRRKLMLELVGVADAVPASRLNELTSAIANECRAVLILLARGFTHFDIIRKTKIFACGLGAGDDDRREGELFAEFDRFCEEIEAIGRKKYLVDVNTTSLLTAAIGAGFDYVDGDAVADLEEQPDGVHGLGLEEIFFPHAGPDLDPLDDDDLVSPPPLPRR